GYRGLPGPEFTWCIFSLSLPFLCVLRSHSSWHSPKSSKTAHNPCYYWLQCEFTRENGHLLIWFFPQLCVIIKLKDPRAAIYSRGRIRTFRSEYLYP
ncbi:hypothetical protein FQF57_22250, partial [Escherichia coli]|nr:hypothetical protein [Escherichia coli]